MKTMTFFAGQSLVHSVFRKNLDSQKKKKKSPHCEIKQCRNEWKSTYLNIHYTYVLIIVSRNLIKIAKVAYNYVYEMALQKEITEN